MANLRLPDDQWFHSSDAKTGICLHHTVGGSAASSIDWWKNDKQMVGTAYVIDRDGTVIEVFDPKGWAYQFGLKWSQADKLPFEKRFIGIEIASEGGLLESGGNLYCFDKVSPRTLKKREEAFDFGKPYRGYRYFDKYEPAQVDSVIKLVNKLIQTFNIEKKIPQNYMDFYGTKLKNFKGVIGHVNIREDKSDPLPDDNFYQRVIKECGLQLTDINGGSATVAGTTAGVAGTTTTAASTSSSLTSEQIDKLFQDNLKQFNTMNRAAGNMVKGLLWELQAENRNTYIRLRDAAANGHVCFYDIVQGKQPTIDLAAQSLGFKSWNSNRLEVFNA